MILLRHLTFTIWGSTTRDIGLFFFFFFNVLVAFLKHNMLHKLCLFNAKYKQPSRRHVNDVDNRHSFKIANLHSFMPLLVHLSHGKCVLLVRNGRIVEWSGMTLQPSGMRSEGGLYGDGGCQFVTIPADGDFTCCIL